MRSIYDTDLYGWAISQAEALRAAARLRLNTPQALDWANLAEDRDFWPGKPAGPIS